MKTTNRQSTNTAGTLLVLTAILLSPLHGGVNTAADFTVHPQVVAAAPPRFGFNLSQSSGSVDITDNAWLFDGGFSSYDARLDYVATDNGASDGTTFISTDTAKYGTDFYNSLNSNGAFNGAQARLYRFNTTTNAWTLVRTGTVQSMTAVSGSTATADHTVTFTTGGAQSLAGDVLWLTKDAIYQTPDISQWVDDLASRFTYYSTQWNAGGQPFFLNNTNPCTYTHVTDVPPGQTNGQSSAPPLSIMITTTATSGTAGISQYLQGVGVTGGEQFEPGHTYNVSVWLKQSGIAGGTATLSIGPVGHTFTSITGTWQQFTFSFAAPGAQTSIPQVKLDYTAPGTLYVNHLVLSDAATSPFTIDPRSLATFQTFHPGVIRIWSGFGNSTQAYSFWSLDSWLQDEGTNRGDPAIGNQYYLTTQQDKLPAALALCKQLNANPWLVCNMSWSEQEWSNFVDYLAAPAGVGYAVNRPASHPGPYTTDFSKIYLEFGNEEWGTQTTFVNSYYGQYAHYMFNQAIAGKSYYDPTKIKLVLNNFTEVDTFGFTALANCPEAQSLDYFLYTGSSATGDAQFQNDLLSIEGYQSDINAWTSAAATSASAGHPYEVTSYEGGNGNDNGSGQPADASLAAGTGQLDVYLYAQQMGMTALNFFGYRLGTGLYTSHTNFANGYIPHPVWEALSMRNQYCAGDIVSTDTNVAPLATDGSNTPLIGVYSFHDPVLNQADIVVISRDLSNSTPVTLHLPTASTGTVTLSTLTGDPRTNNNSGLVVPIAQQSIPSFGNSYSFSMPAGSVYVFQIPTAATWPAAGPTAATIGSGPGYIQLGWNPVTTAVSYNVYRGLSATTIGSTPYATGITSTGYADTGVTTGTTYYYRVTAITPGNVETDTSALVSLDYITGGPLSDINCGGPAISGSSWIADTGSGGYTQTEVTQTIPPTLINPAPEAVYQSLRVQGGYSVPGVTPGAAYTVRIHGQESWDSVGQRIEDVLVNGQTVESGLQWLVAAGGLNIAACRTYSVVQPASTSMGIQVKAHLGTPDGHCEMSGIEVSAGSVPLQPTAVNVRLSGTQATLTWNSAVGATSYSVLYGTSSGSYTQAVQNIAGTTSTITGLTAGTTYYFVVTAVNTAGPSVNSTEVNTLATNPFIAINCGGAAVAGTNWIADTDNNGAGYIQTIGHQTIPLAVPNPAPEAVYSSYHANATYTIPGLTPGKTYIVRLHGEEFYFTAAGKRVANVIINGQTVDTNLDWYALSGGQNIGAVRSYTIVENSTGNLVIQLIKSVNGTDTNMEMCGIEVLGP